MGEKRKMDEKEARRRAIARQRRRRKKIRQRRMLIGAMVLIVLLFVLAVRGIGKSIHKKTEEKKAAEALKIEEQEKESVEATATITTAGDIIMHSPFLNSSVYLQNGEYHYDDIFKYVKDVYEGADFAVTVPEYALTGGDYSGYPTFHSPDETAECLTRNGIDMCLLANNHIYDGLGEGLIRTMDVLEENNILYAGAQKSKEDKDYVIQDINGIRVGFLDYVFETEKVEGLKTINGIAVGKEYEDLLNSFQEAQPEPMYEEVKSILKEMKEEGVEYTIAYMHWGVEYQTEQNEYQEAIAKEFCEMGIDALIASHPHVIQPVDLLTSEDGSHQMICAYAIGNHLSNQRTEYMDGLTSGYSEDGMIVTITIKRDKDGVISLENADFLPTWVYHDQNPDNEYFILPLDDAHLNQEKQDLPGINADVEASLERTNGIIGEGVKKIKDALPIKQ